MKNLKNQKGITLIALVITIIILLILAGVTLAMLTGEGGIIKTAKEAGIETRGASVEEQRDIWLAERYVQKTVGTEQKTMDAILSELSEAGLLSAEEVEIIKNDENNEITIGSKTISFKVDDSGSTGGGTPDNPDDPNDSGNTPEEDNEPPTVTVSTENITENSATLIVTASDSQSGLAETGTYKYYLNDALITTLETNNYTYTGLSSKTNYTLGVIVTDKAGNTSELITTTITTTAPTIKTILREGDYVSYVDKNGTTRTCVVLYGPENTNYSTYGIQIISMSLPETVSLGGSTVAASTSSYNSAITTLNTKASTYLNPTYASSARCVGTIPSNPTSESTSYFSSSYSYMSSYNGTLKNADTNYSYDYNQMRSLGIYSMSDYYWMGSRSVDSYEFSTSFAIWFQSPTSSNPSNNNILTIATASSGGTGGSTKTYGLRPVFTLIPTLTITGGSGTSGSPYTLGT